MSRVRRGNQEKSWKCLKQDEVYARNTSCAQIKEVDFQSNPYFNVKTKDEMKQLNTKIRNMERGNRGHHGHRANHRDEHRIRDNMWYHNNSSDFGRDTLYSNPYVGPRNIYYNNYEYGTGTPYYTTKYLAMP
jgi:hypothetical protein